MPSSDKDNGESNQSKKARVDHQTMPTRQVCSLQRLHTHYVLTTSFISI